MRTREVVEVKVSILTLTASSTNTFNKVAEDSGFSKEEEDNVSMSGMDKYRTIGLVVTMPQLLFPVAFRNTTVCKSLDRGVRFSIRAF